MRVLLAVVFSLFLSTTVVAANKSENRIIAFGIVALKTCSQYLKDTVRYADPEVVKLSGRDYYSEHSVYTQWVAGFVSGYSAGTRKAYPEDLNLYDLMQKIEGYCDKNPHDYFSYAASKAVMEIRK